MGAWRKVGVGAAVATLIAALTVCGPTPARSTADRIYRYVVSGRQHSGDLEDFARQVAETLRDGRGWALGGTIEFERVPSGGDFTVWLSADAAVPSFGSPCSRYYSCRNGRHVVINEARWQTATPVWNAVAGGSMHGRLEHPVTDLSAASEGGYRLLGADGAVFTFGPAEYLGSAS